MPDDSETHEDTGNVVKTSVSLPPYLADWLTELIKTKRFQSKSSVMVAALLEMKGRMEERESAAQEAQTEKEQEQKLEDAEEQLQAKRAEDIALITMILNEYNELKKKHSANNDKLKKVKFE